MRAYVGTSGYDYGDWEGFYPPGLPRGQRLPRYAERFAAVELNFTFYGIPSPAALERMVKATPEGFRFFVKAFREITHERTLGESIERFLASLGPLREADRLGGILLQFPPSFRYNEDGRRYLAAVADRIPDRPLAVEFRDDSWIRSRVLTGMAARGLSFCAVDAPALPGLPSRDFPFTAEPAYLRFHSRNAGAWHGQGKAERYDYDYAEAELREWLPRIESLRERAKTLYAFFNNCHRGSAPRNAGQFARILAAAGIAVVPPEA